MKEPRYHAVLIDTEEHSTIHLGEVKSEHYASLAANKRLKEIGQKPTTFNNPMGLGGLISSRGYKKQGHAIRRSPDARFLLVTYYKEE